ncbi:MAG: glycoside hydrolase family 16 protein [Muribaculaceae bacterium]|nr:glycoside hydrolase family 16 protein [Muribaculaceae bacterium]
MRIKFNLWALAVLAVLLLSPSALSAQDVKWVLDWEDNFDGDKLNTDVWGRCTRGKNDWNRNMSAREDLVEVRDGVLILKGIKNPDTAADKAPYLTGGVWTKGKKSFEPGRMEVRARLYGAKGAWPAIWMLPADTTIGWPMGGEIDIMERLNNNHIVYQTVHSYYTQDLGINEPPHGGTAAINRDEFNVYGVEVLPDKVVFSVNGKHTFTYPKIKTDKEGQYPFYIPMYLLMDMQLGGQWVGAVDDNDLPVKMEIDWVRYYKPAK